MTQLDNGLYYEHIALDPQTVLNNLSKTITNFIQTCTKNKIIDLQTSKYLTPDVNPRIPIFYLLPKVHKPNVPGRPIISGCGSPTDRLSAFVDFYLQPIVETLPSYIKDTNDFLRKIFAIPTPLPTGTILAMIDVKSLYTNIPIDEGILSAILALRSTHSDDWPLLPIIQQFLDFILKQNYFTFKNTLFLQKHGTAMGTKMAPSYANVFMGSLENQFLHYIPIKDQPYIWIRYIDDIFLIWTHGENKFLDFLNKLNSFHPTIKFVSSHSTQEINFLDTTIYIDHDQNLKSDIYIKPTDCLPLLHRQSYYPLSCKMGLIYSQILRYRRIISDEQRFLLRVERLRVTLLARGYRDSDILPAVERASTWTQSQLLEPKEENNTSILPFITP